MNFFDPPLTAEGRPYAPKRYKEIVKERYLISKNSNTSYIDTENITPTERAFLLQFIIDDLTKQKEIIDRQQSKLTKK